MDSDTNIDANKALSKVSENSLESLAKKIQNNQDISNAVNESAVDNMKLFLLVYAKSNLERIIKLTDKLNQMEDRLVDRTLEDEYIDLNQLMSVINLIHRSIDRSVSLIQQVTNDESYLNVVINNAQIINNTIDATVNNNTGDVFKNQFSILNDKSSRQKVISATNAILAELSRMGGTKSDESIEENV